MSAPMSSLLPEPDSPVLSTLNRDGTRLWLKPKLSHGRFLTARRVAAYLLILVFTALPVIHINGKPAMLLDVARRQFTFFGATFLPTDTVLLALFMLLTLVSIFLLTALLGRIWCGWACPQTVYMEFVYRPIERLFEGTRGRGGAAKKRSPLRVGLKYAVYLVISLCLANTFLAYFVGVDELLVWMTRSPLEHPGSFAVMAVTTGLMMFNFSYFREQTCIVACPYGRFQSVLLDRNSLIISYDTQRGEPRGKLQKDGVSLPVAQRNGDCIDCSLCVTTCPTGIDIREGLQMECVGCAQCIDACDAVMDKIHKPRGLIRYTSQARLAGDRGRIARTRVFVYTGIITVLLGAFSVALAWKSTNADLRLLRGIGLPFNTLPDGRISNLIKAKIANRTDEPATYSLSLVDAPAGAELTSSDLPMTVPPHEEGAANVTIALPASAFQDGAYMVRVKLSDATGFETISTCRMLGPFARTKTPKSDSHADEHGDNHEGHDDEHESKDR